MEHKPVYIANTVKALEAILWIVERQPSLDVYHIVKAAYFADKYHVVRYGRPVFGEAYSAAPYGPLPQVMYGLLRGEPLELIALDSNGELPFSTGPNFTIRPTRGPNLRKLSGSDVEALTAGVEHVRGRSFDSIFQETHNDPAYVQAEGARMDYRDFLPSDDPQRAEKAEVIEETAPYAVF